MWKNIKRSLSNKDSDKDDDIMMAKENRQPLPAKNREALNRLYTSRFIYKGDHHRNFWLHSLFYLV